ncbi:hypothetical protein SESBI_35869 [Sesbania bispinosa]|nr:hypothetical protein SESBI_35869 [Sesbania bispinosa]
MKYYKDNSQRGASIDCERRGRDSPCTGSACGLRRSYGCGGSGCWRWRNATSARERDAVRVLKFFCVVARFFVTVAGLKRCLIDSRGV